MALNYRLSPREIGYILNHCKAMVLMVDYEFLPAIREIAGELEHVKHIVVVHDNGGVPDWQPDGAVEYDRATFTVGVPEEPEEDVVEEGGLTLRSSFPVLSGPSTSGYEFEVVIRNETGEERAFGLTADVLNESGLPSPLKSHS